MIPKIEQYFTIVSFDDRNTSYDDCIFICIAKNDSHVMANLIHGPSYYGKGPKMFDPNKWQFFDAAELVAAL